MNQGHHPEHVGLQKHSVGDIYPYILVGYGDDTWGIQDKFGRVMRRAGKPARYREASSALMALDAYLWGMGSFAFAEPDVPKQPADDSVTLKLTRAQAETLRQVCGRIGGTAARTARGDMDDIRLQLDAANVREAGHPVELGWLGAICFAGREQR